MITIGVPAAMPETNEVLVNLMDRLPMPTATPAPRQLTIATAPPLRLSSATPHHDIDHSAWTLGALQERADPTDFTHTAHTNRYRHYLRPEAGIHASAGDA